MLTMPFYSNAECDFIEWTKYNKTTLLKHKKNDSYLFKINSFSLDVDGAPNAYHPQDKGKNCRTNKNFIGVDCLQNAGYKGGNWKSIILPDPKKPDEGYVQPDGIYEGFFISQTSLKDNKKRDTDISKYVNPIEIPYVAIPGEFYKRKGTGKLGDVGYAINIKTGKSSPFILADIGPKNASLGEISLFLASSLGGQNPNARIGSGLPKGDVVFIVFPGSRKSPSWPLSYDELKKIADSHVEDIGGKENILTCMM